MNKWKIDVINMDDLALISEEEIAERVAKCRSEAARRNADPSWKEKWETELAYAQRELQIRQVRRRVHNEYLKNIEQIEYQERMYEQSLPEYEGNKIPRAVKEFFGWN